MEPVPGTRYGLAIYSAPPATSGQAIGGLVAGIGSVLVSLVVGCFGFGAMASAAAGQAAAWGALVGGAFAILATLLGVAGLGLGLAGLRQIRTSAAGVRRGTPPGTIPGTPGAGTGPVSTADPAAGPAGGAAPVGGRGMAVAGIACGGAGIVIALCSLGFALLSAAA